MQYKNILLLFTILLFSVVPSYGMVEKNVHNVEIFQDGNIKHVVVQGETVYSLATAYQVKVSDIYKLNPTAHKGIKIGETILIPSAVNQDIPSPVAEVSAEPAKIESIHVVGKKETLYGVAKKFDLSMDELISANPGLSADNFKVGMVLRIPQKGEVVAEAIVPDTTVVELVKDTVPTFIEYRVGLKETLYGISKKHNTSIDDILLHNPKVAKKGLKEGSVIRIPYSRKIGMVLNDPSQFANTVRVGILLPFLEGSTSMEKEKIVEYYEGMLLAVKEAKKQGLNAEIYTFDLGSATNTDKLKEILETSEMKNLNLLIGGSSPAQIKMISEYSKAKEIPYVVPFGTLESELVENPYMYQATNSHTNLYPLVVANFKKLYALQGYNIIFIIEDDESVKGNRNDFIDELKGSLIKSSTPFNNVVITAEFTSSLASVIDHEKKNVLIPTSSSEYTAKTLATVLRQHQFEGKEISLFGYPEWQVYSSLTSEFHHNNTYIYSMFYSDNHQENIRQFDDEYKLWYGKPLINSYPKYAYLGYDTGLYFLTALRVSNGKMTEKANNIALNTLQSAMHFKKVNAIGGYINKGLYFIHYKPNSGKEKIDINRKW